MRKQTLYVAVHELDAHDAAGEADQDGAKVVHHARYVIFQMAEVAVSPKVFAAILAHDESQRSHRVQHRHVRESTLCQP